MFFGFLGFELFPLFYFIFFLCLCVIFFFLFAVDDGDGDEVSPTDLTGSIIIIRPYKTCGSALFRLTVVRSGPFAVSELSVVRRLRFNCPKKNK